MRLLTVCAAVLLLLGVSAAYGSSDDTQYQTIASQQQVKADLAPSEAAFELPSTLTWDGRYLKTYNADSHLLSFSYDMVNFTDGPVYLAPGVPYGSGFWVHQGDHVELTDVMRCVVGSDDFNDGTCAPQDLTETIPAADYVALAWSMIEGSKPSLPPNQTG